MAQTAVQKKRQTKRTKKKKKERKKERKKQNGARRAGVPTPEFSAKAMGRTENTQWPGWRRGTVGKPPLALRMKFCVPFSCATGQNVYRCSNGLHVLSTCTQT
eukprot:NODE_1335_length_1372_cov_48.815261_g1323_i0.p3 GENE.NODE_1335_length_1372_cov_48.815261_g1323_i0~~NODE_1335_length_1372_cov_48.815261_g1323_i0.p3  ORF type:complete len:103 (+),score=9.00 NODE_1335_length_1372_cov_48.815261_g1323_i0:387-695(+)